MKNIFYIIEIYLFFLANIIEIVEYTIFVNDYIFKRKQELTIPKTIIFLLLLLFFANVFI